jgi:hypothetical protein
MKRLSLFTLLSLVCASVTARSLEQPAAAPVGDGGVIQEGFQLQARTAKQSYRPDEPIIVSVTLRNTTDTARVIHETGKRDGSDNVWTERMFKTIVKDSRGKVVPLTAYGKSIWEKPMLPRGMERTLGAGKEVTYQILMSRVNDVTLSGTYTVSAQTHLFSADRQRWPLVVTNEVQVKVAEE